MKNYTISDSNDGTDSDSMKITQIYSKNDYYFVIITVYISIFTINCSYFHGI